MPFPTNTNSTPAPAPDPAATPAPPPAPSQPAFFPEVISAPPVKSRFGGRGERLPPPRGRTYLLHLAWFLITLLTTTLAGVQLTRGELNLLPLGVGGLPPAPGRWLCFLRPSTCCPSANSTAATFSTACWGIAASTG